MFTSTNFVTLTYTPPLLMQTKFIDSMYTETTNKESTSFAEKKLILFKKN